MADIGEKAFIARLLGVLERHPRLVNGFGQDASVVDLGFPSSNVVMKIDRAAQPIATRKGWSDHRLWGRLAVTSNCSDILASGGEPKALMVALILPPEWPSDAADEIIAGVAEECAAHDVAFIGGDTKEGRSPEVVGSAIGVVRPDRMLSRDGGRPGDAIMIAGRLGGYVGAYVQLENEISISGDARREFLDYVTRPVARWAEATAMNASGLAVAAMDSSDGLFDVLTVFAGSSHGIELDLDAFPYHEHAVAASARYGVPILNFAFGVGDWNILYVVPSGNTNEATLRAKDAGGELQKIGTIVEEPGIRARDSVGRVFEINGVVNEHFRLRMEDGDDYMARLRTGMTLRPI
jgi:thiamine-monophosphate kinase